MALALAVLGIGARLWWPPLPREPRFFQLEQPPLRLWARADQAAPDGLELRVLASEVVIWLESPRELGPVLFLLRGSATTVEVRSGHATNTFEPPAAAAGRLFLEWQPENPRHGRGRPGLFYRFVVRLPELGDDELLADAPRIVFLGTRELLDRDLYAPRWPGCGAPATVAAGEEFLALARAVNESPYPWTHRGNARVRLSYRWYEDGEGVDGAAGTTDLPRSIAPGEELESWLQVRAPAAPGTYELELDLVLAPLGRFSEHGARTCRTAVAVR